MQNTSSGKSSEAGEFYSPDAIDSYHAHYNFIFGKRSNGKTYAILRKIVKNYSETGKQGAYLRRYREDFKGKRGETLFNALIADGVIAELTDGKWTTVKYYSDRWYFARPDEETGRLIADSEPFCYAFSLASMEHDKSTSYPNITTIFFDEVITRFGYLPNEFVTFMNVLSTIIRQRNDVTIYMCANTVNKFCPYFQEMGLGHVEEMEPGTIDIYQYGESKLKVAVERTRDHNIGGRKSEVYFAFDNPNLQMITGGAWELDLYPHFPREYDEGKIIFKYFIDFNDQILQAEVMSYRDCCFTYIHRKTGDIRHPERDIVFSDKYDPRPNHIRNMKHPSSQLGQKIYKFFKDDQVYYQDNDVGELVRNYLMFCQNCSKL